MESTLDRHNTLDRNLNSLPRKMVLTCMESFDETFSASRSMGKRQSWSVGTF